MLVESLKVIWNRQANTHSLGLVQFKWSRFHFRLQRDSGSQFTLRILSEPTQLSRSLSEKIGGKTIFLAVASKVIRCTGFKQFLVPSPETAKCLHRVWSEMMSASTRKWTVRSASHILLKKTIDKLFKSKKPALPISTKAAILRAPKKTFVFMLLCVSLFRD